MTPDDREALVKSEETDTTAIEARATDLAVTGGASFEMNLRRRSDGREQGG